MKRVAVVGPGAIGATMASVLVDVELLLCGRTPHARLLVEREGGATIEVPGPVLTDPAAVPWRADVVLLAVKAHQIAAAAPFLQALCGPETIVVALQNGVEHRELVGPHANGATVVPAVIWFPAVTVAPGHVLVRDDPSVTLPDEPAARAVAPLLHADVSADFDVLAWRKLAVNAVAAVMVLTGRRAVVFRRPDVRELSRALAAECFAVARAEGVAVPDGATEEILDYVASFPDDLGTSMLFDREAGRELEWDARNGVISRLGARHGVPTPASDVIVPLLAAASG